MDIKLGAAFKRLRSADQERFWSWPFMILLIASLAWAIWWRSGQGYPIGDQYPLYFGAKAWLATGNAYDLHAVVTPRTVDPSLDPDELEQIYTKVDSIGNGYPLPAVLLFIPLTALPVALSSIVWFCLLVLGMVFSTRLLRAPALLILLYVPVREGLGLDQYTLLVFSLQIAGVWALLNQDRRSAQIILPFACALMLTKPNQALVLAVVLLALTRRWRWIALAFGLVWVVPTLLDPNWVSEWLTGLRTYREVGRQPVPWYCLLLVIPLLYKRDLLSAAVIAQFSLSPYTAMYSVAPVIIGVLRDPRLFAVILFSWLWPFLGRLFGDLDVFISQELSASIMALVLPAVALALYQREPLIPLPKWFSKPDAAAASPDPGGGA